MEEKTAVVVQAAEPGAVELLRGFRAVIPEESSVSSLPSGLHEQWPGCGNQNTQQGASLKLHVRWQLQPRQLDGPALRAGGVSDHRNPWSQASMEAGALDVQDVGYCNLHRIQERRQAGAWSWSRVQVGPAVLEGQGHRLDLLACAPKQIGQFKPVPDAPAAVDGARAQSGSQTAQPHGRATELGLGRLDAADHCCPSSAAQLS